MEHRRRRGQTIEKSLVSFHSSLNTELRCRSLGPGQEFADSFLRLLLCRHRGRCRRAGPHGSSVIHGPPDTQVEACEPGGHDSDRPEETVKQERAFLRSDPAVFSCSTAPYTVFFTSIKEVMFLRGRSTNAICG